MIANVGIEIAIEDSLDFSIEFLTTRFFTLESAES
jgi:prefoldin subunit 5